MTSAAIQEAVKKANEIDQKVQSFFDKVNDLLEWVPGFLSDLIRPILDGLAAIKRKFDEFWAPLKEQFDNFGNPPKLEEYSATWRETVANPIRTISDDVKLENMSTNIEWEGRGAEAYKTIVPPQSEGLADIKDLAVDISETLKELANGIEDFWIAIGIALGSLVIGMVAAIVEAATVVGIPAAIATIIAAIGVAFAAVTAAIVALKGIYDTLDTKQEAIQNGLNDLGDKWSKSKHGMNNPADWEPR